MDMQKSISVSRGALASLPCHCWKNGPDLYKGRVLQPSMRVWDLHGEVSGVFTKPSLLQESRLTGGGSHNLVGLVEWRSLWCGEWELQAVSFHFTHDYTCNVQVVDPNWFCAAVSPSFLCTGISTLQGHSQWESQYTPAL